MFNFERSRKNHDQAVAKLTDLAGQAFENTQKQLGETQNPELAYYKTLNDNDFKALEEAFGLDETADYVKAMEIELAKEGNHGN